MNYLEYDYNFISSLKKVKIIFLIVAMESEEKAILGEGTFSEKTLGKRIKIRVKELKTANRKIIIGRSGVGLVNAGILLNLAAESYPLDAVVLLGVGGALDERLQPGDTVVSNKIIQHDSISSHEDGDHLIAPGELTLSAPQNEQVDPVMRCDEKLKNWIKSLLLPSTGKVYEGTILSGSEFVANSLRKKDLRKLDKDALLVDMESAALAQIARKLKLPFVAAKTVADRANPKKSISEDYKAFLSAASEHGRHVIRGLK
ncbi:MAG: 5'-methylthioadenosine/S-adenosylhomocysteine nucleosidase [Bdellovibrionota bacterium]